MKAKKRYFEMNKDDYYETKQEEFKIKENKCIYN